MIDLRRLLLGRFSKKRPTYEDPVAGFGRLLQEADARRDEAAKQPSLWARFFRRGHDSDFVYYDD
jgi:hypothetical protein